MTFDCSMLRPAVVLMCRGLFLAGGFHWVTVRGTRVGSEEAPILTVVPHSSYFDALPVVALDLSTIVAKAASERVPFFSSRSQYCICCVSMEYKWLGTAQIIIIFCQFCFKIMDMHTYSRINMWAIFHRTPFISVYNFD